MAVECCIELGEGLYSHTPHAVESSPHQAPPEDAWQCLLGEVHGVRTHVAVDQDLP